MRKYRNAFWIGFDRRRWGRIGILPYLVRGVRGLGGGCRSGAHCSLGIFPHCCMRRRILRSQPHCVCGVPHWEHLRDYRSHHPHTMPRRHVRHGGGQDISRGVHSVRRWDLQHLSWAHSSTVLGTFHACLLNKSHITTSTCSACTPNTAPPPYCRTFHLSRYPCTLRSSPCGWHGSSRGS